MRTYVKRSVLGALTGMAAAWLAVAGCAPDEKVTNVYQVVPGGPEPAPTLMFVEPVFGSSLGGDAVTLTGFNFSTKATVAFGGTAAATVSIVSSSTIFCTTPPGAVGFADVTVTHPDGQLSVRPKAWEYRLPPVISTVMPPSGTSAGGQTIVLLGTGFQTGCTLTIGGAAATGISVNATGTKVSLVTPAGSVGAATILVTNPDLISDTDTFLYAAAGGDPVVASVTPGAGPPSGGTTVTITGANVQTAGTTRVWFGLSPATSVGVLDASTLTCVTPAGTSGTVVDVVLVNPNGLSTTRPSIFGYDSSGTPPTFAGAGSAVATSPFSLVVSWPPATDNVTPAARIMYQVYVATSSYGQDFTTPTLATAPGVTQAMVGGLSPGTTLYFIVRATDEVGNQDTNSKEVSGTPPIVGTYPWRNLNALANAREDHTAVVLTDGRVLVAGGRSGSSSTTGLASAEVYDPATGTWTAGGSLGAARYAHTATVLPSGRVLVTGGDDNGLLGSTETYDAPNATWTAAGSLGTARWGHTATLLANGQVLVVGGDSSGALASCERFDPVGGTWTAAGALATGRTGHTATRLGNGRVLAVGGEDGSGTAYASTELYDPTADTWTASGSLGTARRFHTTTLLGNGRVLAVAGENAGVLATCEWWDASTGAWTAAGSLTTARQWHTATLVPCGRLLVVGGDNAGALANAEQYDPNADTWYAAGTPGTARARHAACLLPVGEVLVLGGDNAGTATGACEQDPNFGKARSGPVMPNIHGYGFSMTPLPDGRIAMLAGYTGSSPYQQLDLYDPTTGTWTAGAPIPTGTASMYYHTANVLQDGRLLPIGSVTSTTGGARTYLYDPAAGTWTETGRMTTNYKYYHCSAVLADGRVLAFAGIDGSGGSYSSNAQLYDPATGSWTATGSLNIGRYLMGGVRLADGRVLTMGGYNAGYLFTAEIYDPATGAWSMTNSMAMSRQYPGSALLPNGKVIVIGGYGMNGPSFGYHNTAELWDPATGTWQLTGAPAAGGYGFALAMLPSGRLMKSGGYNLSYRTEIELYDPGYQTWTTVTTLANGGYFRRAATLATGEVLIAGGYEPTGGGYGANTYLWNEGRGHSDLWAPRVASVGGGTLWPVTLPAAGTTLTLAGTGFRGTGEAGGGNARSSGGDAPMVTIEGPLGLVDNSYMTHGTVPLRVLPGATFSADGLQVLVPMPATGVLQKGAYLLRVTVGGIPSGARQVRVP